MIVVVVVVVLPIIGTAVAIVAALSTFTLCFSMIKPLMCIRWCGMIGEAGNEVLYERQVDVHRTRSERIGMSKNKIQRSLGRGQFSTRY